VGTRERVRDAIRSSVDDAERELRDLQDAEAETRLTVLIAGWGRGLAAAAEELAIAIDELEEHRVTNPERKEDAPPVVDVRPTDSDDQSEKPDLAGADEDRLAEEARRSRAATAELREEGEESRRRLER
jgi:hypothetical protein